MTRCPCAERHAALWAERRAVLHFQTRRSAGRERRCSERRETHRSARHDTRVMQVDRRARARCARVPGARSLAAQGRPVWPFSSCGRAAGGRRHALQGTHTPIASPSHLRALARLEPNLGLKKALPGFAVRFQRQKKKQRKAQREDAQFRSQARGECRLRAQLSTYKSFPEENLQSDQQRKLLKVCRGFAFG